jgi:SAM-dependent methyltransferase
MLLDQENVFKLLRCPKSGEVLKLVNNKLIIENNEKTYEYGLIHKKPILINFENSVIDKQDVLQAAPIISRNKYAGPLGIAKRLVSPTVKITDENISYLINNLLKHKENPRILIVGGGSVGGGMESLYEESGIELVSFDIYNSPFVQFIADAHSIPLPDLSFDAVIVQAVLEHVLEPSTVVREVYRVLKTNGFVYAETPFLQNVHEGAYDFTRYTDSGHRYLFRDFKLINSGVSTGAGTQLLWSLDFFIRGVFRSKMAGKTVKLLLFWIKYFDKLIPNSYNIDSASGLFFLGKKDENQSVLSVKNIVSYYKGAQ